LSDLDFQEFKIVLRQYGYELCQRRNTVFIRKRPWTRDAPTTAMQDARNALGLVAGTMKGTQGLSEEGLPQAATQTRRQMRDAMLFLRATKPDERVEYARQVADEIGLEPEEKERLIKLVSLK